MTWNSVESVGSVTNDHRFGRNQAPTNDISGLHDFICFDRCRISSDQPRVMIQSSIGITSDLFSSPKLPQDHTDL